MRFMPVARMLLFFFLALPLPVQGQALIQAIQNQDEAEVRRLVSENPSLVHETDDRQCTPLHFAIHRNRADFVDLLLENGADPNVRDYDGDTPITWAVLYEHEEMWTLLLEHGVDVEMPNNYDRTPLLQVARETGNETAARALLTHGADPDAQDRFGATSLNLAAWRGFRGVVDALMDHGADLGTGGPLARPNIEFAAQKGLDRLFSALLEAGADLGHRTANGGSLLHSAGEGGSTEIVSLLLDRSFDPGERDRYGWTPLHYAAERGRTEASELLISAGADVNAVSLGGHTPLSLTETYGMEEEARLLEAHGALRESASTPVLEGPWMGQTPPGSEAVVFAPDIVSSARFEHGTVAFSPDGTEAFWESSFMPNETGYSWGRVLTSRMEDGGWTRPEYAPFSTDFMAGDDVPFFHPNGDRLFFLSRRPTEGEEEGVGERIWYVDRTSGGWSEPRIIQGGPNAVGLHWQFSVAANGNIYHSANLPSGFGGGDIYVSLFVNGAYLPPESLGPVINSEGSEASPFIAPDESYLIITGEDRSGSFGAADLYISFRTPEGDWTSPLNMGPTVNTATYDMCPMVTGDGRFLIWNSRPEGDSDNYWRDASIIEELRAQVLGGEE